MNRLFLFLFESRTERKVQTKYYIPKVQIKDCNIIIDGRNFFDQPIKNALKTCDNIRMISTGQRDDKTTGCLLNYPYFKELYKLVAIDLSKQQKIDAEAKAKQQINFTGNPKKRRQQYFSLLKKRKKQFSIFQKGQLN